MIPTIELLRRATKKHSTADKHAAMLRAKRDALMLRAYDEGYSLVSIGRVLFGEGASKQRVFLALKQAKKKYNDA